MYSIKRHPEKGIKICGLHSGIFRCDKSITLLHNVETNGAIAAFLELIKNANGNLPDAIRTDPHRPYRQSVYQTFAEENSSIISPDTGQFYLS